MPRAPYTTPSIRVERSANSSAAGVYPRRQNQTVQIQDKSQWRGSWIDVWVTIGKTAAMSKYHIGARDLQGLRWTMGMSPVRIGGVRQFMPMHNYIEREVEMRAWEKYGGPERFEETLIKKAATFYRRHGHRRNKPFPKPSTYILVDNAVPVARNCRLPAVLPAVLPEVLPDAEISTPTLAQIKAQMEERGEIWLWNLLKKSIAESENNDFNLENHFPPAFRESLMLSASETLRDYPKRPISPPPLDAPSFKALNDLLAQAPLTHSQPKYDTPAMAASADLVVSNVYVDWDKSYRDKVHGCLDDISTEYGLHGLKKAQWLVYDKHVECNMGGLRYYRQDGQHTGSKWMWYDASKSWLNRKQPALRISV